MQPHQQYRKIRVNTFILIAGGFVAGRLYDKGYFYPLLWGGSFINVFGLFMLSLAQHNHYYQVFLSQGITMGIGIGLCYVPSAAIMTHYFRERRALALTIAASGSSLGAIIHPIMLNNFLGSRLSFGNSVRASAGLVAGFHIIACSVMHPRLPFQPKPPGKSGILVKLCKDVPYVLTTLGLMILAIGFYFPQFYIQLDAILHGLDKSFSFYTLVILNVASIFGRILPGLFANRLGIENLVAFSAMACSAIIFGMIGLKTVASVVILALTYGFFSGTFVSLTVPLIIALTDDLSELGVRIGVAFFFTGIGALIGTPIGGALLTEHFLWVRLAIFCGTLSAVGSCLFVAIVLVLRYRRLAVATNDEKQRHG